MARKSRITLKKILSEYGDEVKQAAVESINAAADELESAIKGNMDKAGIKEDTGALRGRIKVRRATVKSLDATIKSEVYAPLPKKPGARNPDINYPAEGVPYGRLIEFSPRINKPFFYTAWYEKRQKIYADIADSIHKAGNK